MACYPQPQRCLRSYVPQAALRFGGRTAASFRGFLGRNV